MGLDPESQSKYGQWYMMLSALDALETANPTADTYANPFKECLHRLSAFEGSHPYRELAQEFGTRIG